MYRLTQKAEGKQHDKAAQRLPNAPARKQERADQPRQEIEEKRNIPHEQIRVYITLGRHFHIFERNELLPRYGKHRAVLHRAHHTAEEKQNVHQMGRCLRGFQHPLFHGKHQRKPCRQEQIDDFPNQLHELPEHRCQHGEKFFECLVHIDPVRDVLSDQPETLEIVKKGIGADGRLDLQDRLERLIHGRLHPLISQ